MYLCISCPNGDITIVDFFFYNLYDQCTIGEQFIIMLVVSSVIISMNKTLLLISEKAPAFVTNMAIV
jgi:hypothetical protein